MYVEWGLLQESSVLLCDWYGGSLSVMSLGQFGILCTLVNAAAFPQGFGALILFLCLVTATQAAAEHLMPLALPSDFASGNVSPGVV